VTSTATYGINNPGSPDKIDVYINYAVSGQFTVYYNNVVIATYSGDVTTDSQTSLSFVDFGVAGSTNTGGNNVQTAWSEIIVATQDTRNMSLVTQVASAPGNTDTFTAEGLSNVVFNSGGTNSTFSQGSDIWYTKVIPTLSGPLISLQVNFSVGLTGTTAMALYTDGAGPTTLLATGITITNPTSGLQNYTVSGGPTLVAGTAYWIAFRSSASYVLLQNASTPANWGASQAYASSFPSTASVSMQTPWAWMQMTVAVPNNSLNLANYASPDYSSTAAQIQEYKITPAIPTGNFSVVSVVQHGMCTVGPTGPQHIQFMVRTGSTDYTSSSLSPGTGWGLLTYNWDTNPNTSAAWATTDLVASSTAFNFGFESIT
jgi:hypothetical protein